MALNISAGPHTPTLKPLHGMPPARNRAIPSNSKPIHSSIVQITNPTSNLCWNTC